MDVIDSRVRKCEDVSTIIDKKMRTRTIKFERFIVPLENNNPFNDGEFVKVLRKSDFEMIGELLKKVRSERDSLKKELEDIDMKNQKTNLPLKGKKNKSSIFRGLIEI